MSKIIGNDTVKYRENTLMKTARNKNAQIRQKIILSKRMKNKTKRKEIS